MTPTGAGNRFQDFQLTLFPEQGTGKHNRIGDQFTIISLKAKFTLVPTFSDINTTCFTNKVRIIIWSVMMNSNVFVGAPNNANTNDGLPQRFLDFKDKPYSDAFQIHSD